MAEQFEHAAARHFRIASHLEGIGEIDDAAYHYGVCGETILKHAIEVRGMRTYWEAAGVRLNETPLRGHFPNLRALASSVREEIALNASGRYAASLIAEVESAGFASRFDGWMIEIRYADDRCTPVQEAACRAWGVDAEELFSAFGQ